jgi:hypothetical protein
MLTDSEQMVQRMYRMLDRFTCNGVQASRLSGCISPDGYLCSDAGNCTSGQYCEAFTSSSYDNTVTVLLGTLHRRRLPFVAHALPAFGPSASIIPAAGVLCQMGVSLRC